MWYTLQKFAVEDAVLRRLFENKLLALVLTTILLVSFIILSAIPGSPLAGATKPLSFIVDPIQSVFQKIGTKLSDFYSAIADGMEIRKENERLKEEIAELEYKVQQGEEARIRWEELKSAFQIQDTFENYHIRGASVNPMSGFLLSVSMLVHIPALTHLPDLMRL